MRMYDLIEKKKRGHALDKAEICWMIQSYTAGQIPDYQMAAFLMAVCFQGMDLQETTEMTLAMAHSGQMADLSGIAGVKVDKHSTGGVGDKTTLIAAPMAAACGIPIAKMSGRGLGFTGGTVDKLESIPGYRTVLPREEFFEIVNEVGISLIGQSGEMAVADKKIYALRDVTATVDSLPLIASSIMSKKIAAGADAILLDVKTGSGAFMKTLEEAKELARVMTEIGNRAGRRTGALITNMDRPLGYAVGNALEVAEAGRRTAALITDMDTPLGDTAGNAIEVQEAIWTLRGKGPADLTELCIHLAGNMLWLAGQGEPEDCLRRAAASLQDGSAYRCFYRMVQRQGGDVSYLEQPEKFQLAPVYPIQAPQDGYIASMQTDEIGNVVALLGAGRERKEDAVDAGAGIRFTAKTGAKVCKGQTIALLYTHRPERVQEATERYVNALHFSQSAPSPSALIQERITEV